MLLLCLVYLTGCLGSSKSNDIVAGDASEGSDKGSNLISLSVVGSSLKTGSPLASHDLKWELSEEGKAKVGEKIEFKVIAGEGGVLSSDAEETDKDGIVEVQLQTSGSDQTYQVEASWQSGRRKSVIAVISSDTIPMPAPNVAVSQGAQPKRPVWTWSSSSGASTGVYRYKLNSGSFTDNDPTTTVTSYTPTSDLSVGIHTLFVQERGANGKWSGSGSAIFSVAIETVSPPSVTAGSGPSARRPRWAWVSSASNGSGTYRYKLNSSSFTSGDPTTTSTSYTPSSDLSLGQHTLYVQELGSGGVWSLSGSASYTVSGEVVLAPAVLSGSGANSKRPVWTWISAAPNGSGVGTPARARLTVPLVMPASEPTELYVGNCTDLRIFSRLFGLAQAVARAVLTVTAVPVAVRYSSLPTK